MDAACSIRHAFTRRFVWAGYLIGFALGGFFDGILLHQILQWHHLLSGVQAEALRDLRVQVVADGVFHGLMYIVAAAGLWLLYGSRNEFTGARADRNLVAYLLIGFGVWHVIDAVLSHWLTRIHRIRMDVAEPLVWDIAWLVVFGLVPLSIGLLMKRRYPREVSLVDRRAPGRHGLVHSIGACTLALAAWAALPPAGTQGTEAVTVVLRPDVRPGAFLAALEESDARVLWSDRSGGVWVMSAAKNSSAMRYYRHGALYVSGSLLPAGCSAWLRT
jgi:uncharacterized membrane protein